MTDINLTQAEARRADRHGEAPRNEERSDFPMGGQSLVLATPVRGQSASSSYSI